MQRASRPTDSIVMAKIYIGTSGWQYQHWVSSFYPAELAPGQFLTYYAEQFRTVEINNTFYQLPQPETLVRWREAAPKQFVFASKAHRYITHFKKLNNCEDSICTLFNRLEILESKLGPILFQLPPRWHVNIDRLACFLDALPEGYRYGFEFRDRSWLIPEVYELLENHRVALCAYDLGGFRSPVVPTADFFYIRLHGPEGPYHGSYDGRTLNSWVRRFARWLKSGQDVYCYFDNDEHGYAAANAARMQQMVGRYIPGCDTHLD